MSHALLDNPALDDPNAFLPFALPSISDAAIQEVVDCLRSGWITTGPRVQRFEEALATYFQVSSVLTVNSGTAGLFLALKAIGLQLGDEVITTPLTFAATLNVIVLAGGKPVLVDVDSATYNLDISQIEAAITPKTRAIMPVHFAGLPVEMTALYALAKKHNLRVIEDAAHAIGSHYQGRPIGSFGDIQVFSFHPNKNMTTGEGGCVVTQDSAIQKQISVLRFHGIDRPAFDRFAKKGSPHYDIVQPGHKFNMMDLQAALGLHQLAALEGFIEKRQHLAQRYFKLLADIPQLILPPSSPSHMRHNWHLFAPLVNLEMAKLSRDDVMTALKERNIGTGLHYPACHLYSYYRDHFGFKKGDFPKAESIGERIFSLPLFPDMTEAQQDRVVVALRDIFGG